MGACEICGKNDNTKIFSPQGQYFPCSLCNTCYVKAGEAEQGIVNAVNYFTQNTDLSNATENGKKCVEKCLEHAKEAIESKLNSIQTEEKETENELDEIEELAICGMLVTSTDTLIGHSNITYHGIIEGSDVFYAKGRRSPVEVTNDIIDKLKPYAYQEFGANSIIGLKVTNLMDNEGNILVYVYGTAISIND